MEIYLIFYELTINLTICKCGQTKLHFLRWPNHTKRGGTARRTSRSQDGSAGRSTHPSRHADCPSRESIGTLFIMIIIISIWKPFLWRRTRSLRTHAHPSCAQNTYTRIGRAENATEINNLGFLPIANWWDCILVRNRCMHVPLDI